MWRQALPRGREHAQAAATAAAYASVLSAVTGLLPRALPAEAALAYFWGLLFGVPLLAAVSAGLAGVLGLALRKVGDKRAGLLFGLALWAGWSLALIQARHVDMQTTELPMALVLVLFPLWVSGIWAPALWALLASTYFLKQRRLGNERLMD